MCTKRQVQHCMHSNEHEVNIKRAKLNGRDCGCTVAGKHSTVGKSQDTYIVLAIMAKMPPLLSLSV